MVTSRDVARHVGVSQATISRAMASSPKVSPETKARVLAAAEVLGYLPNSAAQSMKTRRTRTIGVVVNDISNPFYPEVLDELTREFDAANYRVVIWNAGVSNPNDALYAIRRRAVDGIILTTATNDSIELYAALREKSVIVLINRLVEGLDCDQVSSDNRGGGAAVADYLIASGKPRTAFIGGSPNASTSRDRGLGFSNRMAELGHPVSPQLTFQGEFSHNLAFHIMTKLLALPDTPQAVFCANDYMAFGALDALRSQGLSAPRDCWIIGYDDIDMASWPSFDLTTVRQPGREMARIGAKMLLNRMSSPTSPIQTVKFPFELIIRGSTSSGTSPSTPISAAIKS